MSDRHLVINMQTRANHPDNQTVELFMDGDTGTWRLFLEEAGNRVPRVDFSLAGLIAFRDALTKVLQDVENHPDSFNAEVRYSWDDK